MNVWSSSRGNYRYFTQVLKKRQLYATTFVERFQSPGHTGYIEDVCITFINKKDPFLSIKRED